MQALKRPSSARRALWLFLGAFLVYNLNCRPISSGDSAPAALLPFSIYLDGTITLDRYAPWLEQRYGGQASFLYRKAGHFYSLYPIATPLILTPLYAPLSLAPSLRQWPVMRLVLLARVLEKIAASLVAACSVAFLFLLLRRLTQERRALLLVFLYAFATNTWSTSSQALWQHGMSQLIIILSLLCLDRFLEDEKRWGSCAGAGLFASMSVAVRPTNVLFFGLSCTDGLLRRRWKLLASNVGFGAVCGLALAIYNVWLFGHLQGGYAAQSLDGNFFTGLAGLLVSPSRGLFVYSPVLLFLFPSLYVWLHSGVSRGRVVLLISLWFSVAHLLLYACFPRWWAGDCFGPRYMADVLPCLVILLIPVLPLLDRSGLTKAIFAVLLIFSVWVQTVGAFCYLDGIRDQRFGDWRRSPIVTCSAAGADWRGNRLLWDLLVSRATGRQLNFKKYNFHVQ